MLAAVFFAGAFFSGFAAFDDFGLTGILVPAVFFSEAGSFFADAVAALPAVFLAGRLGCGFLNRRSNLAASSSSWAATFSAALSAGLSFSDPFYRLGFTDEPFIETIARLLARCVQYRSSGLVAGVEQKGDGTLVQQRSEFDALVLRDGSFETGDAFVRCLGLRDDFG